MRYMIRDELWTILGPCVAQAKRYKCGAEPELPERMFFEAVLYWARTGISWRDLPSEFGAWDAVYNRFRRWIASGNLAKLFELLTDELDWPAASGSGIRRPREASGRPAGLDAAGADRFFSQRAPTIRRPGFSPPVRSFGFGPDTSPFERFSGSRPEALPGTVVIPAGQRTATIDMAHAPMPV